MYSFNFFFFSSYPFVLLIAFIIFDLITKKKKNRSLWGTPEPFSTTNPASTCKTTSSHVPICPRPPRSPNSKPRPHLSKPLCSKSPIQLDDPINCDPEYPSKSITKNVRPQTAVAQTKGSRLAIPRAILAARAKFVRSNTLEN